MVGWALPRDSIRRKGIAMKKILFAVGCFGLIASLQLFGQDAEAGKSLFEANCGVCHNADSDVRKMGPGLKGVMHKETLTNGTEVTEENVLNFINTGGNGMPSFDAILSDTEKTNLMAYLNTL